MNRLPPPSEEELRHLPDVDLRMQDRFERRLNSKHYRRTQARAA